MTQNSKWYGKWLDVQADRDRLVARVRELEAALTAFVEAEDINRQYDGTYDSPPGHVVAEMYERAAAMARAALAAEALAILAGDPEPDQRPAPETTPHPVPFMTRPELAEEMERLYQEEQRLREAGQQEYARTDNAFANFVRVAEYLGLRPEQVLLVYLLKHIDGISAWANGHRSQRENVRGRINDARVYLAILAGMARCYEEASAALADSGPAGSEEGW